MAKLTISEASRVTGVSRMLLSRDIKAGKLSHTLDGGLDTAEILKAGLLLHQSDVTPPVTTPVTTETHTLERLIDAIEGGESYSVGPYRDLPLPCPRRQHQT